MQRYRDRIIERRKTRGEIFRKGLRDEALRLIQLLMDNGFRFKKIYLFGSSIKEKPLAPWSDTDLAIEGLNKEIFYKVYAFLLKNSSEESGKISNRRILGSIRHDFYNCCERIFRRISTEINGGFEQRETWHKELLYRMTIEIKGLRPEVISEDLAAELDDYLSFRHLFRNIYGFELKGERLEARQ